VEPLHAEQHQQSSDDETEGIDRHTRERRPEEDRDSASTAVAAAPTRVDRQPQVTPTARTIVSTSIISTPEAGNVASISRSPCIEDLPRIRCGGGLKPGTHCAC